MEIKEELERYQLKLMGAFEGFEKVLDILEKIAMTVELKNGSKMEVNFIEVLAKMFQSHLIQITACKEKSDFKKGRWYWDDVDKKCFKFLHFIRDDGQSFSIVRVFDKAPEFGESIPFERNRFYPIMTINELTKEDLKKWNKNSN